MVSKGDKRESVKMAVEITKEYAHSGPNNPDYIANALESVYTKLIELYEKAEQKSEQ